MEDSRAYGIAQKKMLNQDAFSLWLGAELLEIGEGHCKLKMKVRKEMTNGFGIAHGGISYSLADSALAFASNAYGKMAVSIETSISHLVKVKVGETLFADAVEINRTEKIGIYEVEVKNNTGLLVSKFKGTVYISSKEW